MAKRGRPRKNIIKVEDEESKTIIVKQKEEKKSSKEKLLKEAKDLGLFQYNKMYKQYEIIIPANEYEKI